MAGSHTRPAEYYNTCANGFISIRSALLDGKMANIGGFTGEPFVVFTPVL
jgi:hypothetical protein